ncbi:MAG: tetratricopeptide repeat protein, partial [Nitrospiraceae bacterium]
MRADKKTPIRAVDKKNTLRAHKRVAAEAVKKNILLEEAIVQMNAGKYGQAAGVLKQLLATNPDNLEGRRLFATLHLRLGSLMTAKTAFESLAQEAMQRQDFWLAESLLKEYLAAGPRCVPFLELLGNVYEEKGDPLSAVVEYGKAIEILVEDPDPDQPNRAADLFGKVKELAPTSPVASRFGPMFGVATTFTSVTAETTAEVNAPPTPAGETEPAVEPTESVSTEAEEISAPAEPESSVERDPLLPSLHMAPEVELPLPEPEPAELHAEPAAASVLGTVEALPPLPPEVLAELGLPELSITPESEAEWQAEPAVAETKEVDPILPSVELAPAVEVEAPLPEPVSVTEPEPSATSTPARQEETPPWEPPALEPAGQETPAAGYRFIGEAEASVEASRVPTFMEPAPPFETPLPSPELLRVMPPEPELAVAGAYQAAGESLAPAPQAAGVGMPKTRTAPSLVSRLARQAAHVRLRVSLFVRGCIAAARFLALSALAAVTISLVLTVL